jgi:hypothetical protein
LPRETLRHAADAGLDMTALTTELEQDGVRAFCDSYRDLLACIEAKLEQGVAADR